MQIESLVFEGGGVRGIAFGGVIKYLEENNIINDIKNFAGSSAGAIIATGLSIGYNSDEMVDILRNIDFDTFKDDSWGIFQDMYRFITQYGLYKGDALLKWISIILENKTGNKNITFKQIYETYGKTLVITGCCLNKNETFYFHHKNPLYEDMPVSLAVRISMSIPFYWKPVKYRNDILIDGGILNNYPIWVFDGDYIGDYNITEYKAKNSKTLGFKLTGEDERKDFKLYNSNIKIKSIYDFGKALIDTLRIDVERRHIKSDYWDRTVCINTFDVKSLDFDIDLQTKNMLITEGYNATKNYFDSIESIRLEDTGESTLV